MNNRKIVIINNGLALGGIQKASSFLANSLDSLGHNVILLSLYKTNTIYFNLNKGIEFIEPTFDRSTNSPQRYVLRMMLYIRKWLKLLKPDVILSFGEWTNSFVIIATRRLNIPVFVSDRMSPMLSLGLIQNFLKKVMYKHADGIIAQTSYAKNVLNKNTGNCNIKVIPNPVSIVNLVECPKKNQIITIGRLSKEKGHKYLIDAFSKIKNKQWQLLIVGDGTERQSLEMQCIDLGLNHRVTFVGGQKELSNYLSESKIFVLPSLSEGYPNALIEAMTLPIACISTDCIAGPGDIIKDEINGLLVEPANSDMLAKAIDRLIDDDCLGNFIANNAYKIRDELNAEVIVDKYLSFVTTSVTLS